MERPSVNRQVPSSSLGAGAQEVRLVSPLTCDSAGGEGFSMTQGRCRLLRRPGGSGMAWQPIGRGEPGELSAGGAKLYLGRAYGRCP